MAMQDKIKELHDLLEAEYTKINNTVDFEKETTFEDGTALAAAQIVYEAMEALYKVYVILP